MRSVASDIDSIHKAQIAETEFRQIADLLHQMTGIFLRPAKRAMVSARLSKRLKAIGFENFGEYCAYLDSPKGADERQELIELLTTNVTSFNRESHQFVHLTENVLPSLVSRLRQGERVRFWSAGCSSGQEAYELAIRMLDACPEIPSLNFRILATDIDRKILEQARAGVYPKDALSPLEPRLADRYFSHDASTEKRKIAEKVRGLVSFKQLNLQADWPFHGPFDVIMCRNVTIYFDAETQARLWTRFAEKLDPEGWLYIGHSESITRAAAGHFTSAAPSVFKRRPGTAASQSTASSLHKGDFS